MYSISRTIGLGACFMWLIACGDDDLRWRADIQGQDDWEDVTGTADVVWEEDTDSFSATAQIENDEPGAVRPWHVHFNTCEEGGAIVGNDEDYPRLEVGEDGTASASASIPATLSRGQSYHVNIHQSEAELETIIACGNLILD